MRLIGINGGTFDPIHLGHLRAAREAQYLLGLEQVRFIPCYQPVHREGPQVSAEQRTEMVRQAIEPIDGFELDTIELDRKGPSYMVDTLETLKERFVEVGLVLMMGTDAFSRFHTWHQWQRILTLANIVVMHRPGENVSLFSEAGQILRAHQVAEFTQSTEQIQELAITQLDVSSTAIRRHLLQGQPIDFLVPTSVQAYITEQQLYAEPSSVIE